MKNKMIISKFLAFFLISSGLFQYSLTSNALDKQTECTICLEDLNRQPITELECGHKFCTGCLDTWEHKGKHTCPNCRAWIRVKQKLNQNNNNLNANNNNNDNNYNNNDLDAILREYDEFNRIAEERRARFQRFLREKREEEREEERKEQARRDRLNAPLGDDGMTEYERDYYDKNCKKILDDGLEKMSHANDKTTLDNICKITFKNVSDSINLAEARDIGLDYIRMCDYTENTLRIHRNKRWEQIKPTITSFDVAMIASTGMFGVAGVAHVGVQRILSNQSKSDAEYDDVGDIGNVDVMEDVDNIDNENTTGDINNTDEDNNINMFNADDKDDSIENIFEFLA